jgi:hypothetical protein
MIFCDGEGYWQREPVFDSTGAVTQAGVKLDVLIPQVIRFGRARQGYKDRKIWEQKVLFTTDFDEIADALSRHAPLAQRNLTFLLLGESTKVTLAAFNRA